MFHVAGNGRKTNENVRLEIYVDDPAITACGSLEWRNRAFSIIVLTWRALGFKLSFSKAKRGCKVPWIGNVIWMEEGHVKAAILEYRVVELTQLVDKYMEENVISLKNLRTLAGKANSFATLLFCWRPFLSELWGALHSDNVVSGSKAPPGCIWTKQCLPTLKWLSRFLHGREGSIVRVYSIANYAGHGSHLRL